VPYELVCQIAPRLAVSPTVLLSAEVELYSCLPEAPRAPPWQRLWRNYEDCCGAVGTKDGKRLDTFCRTLALPYALTLIVLAFFSGQARDPSALGIPYIRT
jgi:hypothetical protein